MAQYYPVNAYYSETRNLLQDLVPPYRYPDQDIINALNFAIGVVGRVRPDLFLDLKYQQPLPAQSPLSDGLPGQYLAPMGIADLTPIVPIPSTYLMPFVWYMAGYLQFYDVDDTQDVRAQTFHTKFIGSLINMAA